MVRRTLADVHREDGEKLGEQRGELNYARATLLRQVNLRFAPLPCFVEPTIEQAKLPQLNTWLSNFATATSLDDVGIAPAVMASR